MLQTINIIYMYIFTAFSFPFFFLNASRTEHNTCLSTVRRIEKEIHCFHIWQNGAKRPDNKVSLIFQMSISLCKIKTKKSQQKLTQLLQSPFVVFPSSPFFFEALLSIIQLRFSVELFNTCTPRPPYLFSLFPDSSLTYSRRGSVVLLGNVQAKQEEKQDVGL